MYEWAESRRGFYGRPLLYRKSQDRKQSRLEEKTQEMSEPMNNFSRKWVTDGRRVAQRVCGRKETRGRRDAATGAIFHNSDAFCISVRSYLQYLLYYFFHIILHSFLGLLCNNLYSFACYRCNHLFFFPRFYLDLPLFLDWFGRFTEDNPLQVM